MAPSVVTEHRERCNWANLVVFYSVPLVIAWTATLWASGTHGIDFLSETRWSMADDAEGEAGTVAKRQLFARFQQKAAQYQFSQAVLITAKNPHVAPVFGTAVSDLTERVLNTTIGGCVRDKQPCWWRTAHGLFVEKALERLRLPGADDSDLDLLAEFVSPDNRSTLLVITCAYGYGAAGNSVQRQAWGALQQTLDAWVQEHGEDYEAETVVI